MTWVSTAAQVRELDRRVIEELGLPGVALMEVASQHVANAIFEHHAAEAARGTLVVCGAGNNGGDGWAIARWLHQAGIPVSVWALAPPKTPDAQTMATVARNLGVPEVDAPGEPGLIVDAVFGNGLTRPVEGELAAHLTTLAGLAAPVVAVDLPSGMHADRGVALGTCLPAVRTITLGRPKLGLYGADAALCGIVECADIGLGAGDRNDAPAAHLATAERLRPQWPRRRPDDHKGKSGRLLIIAGSTEMAGAAMLTCWGALAAGAGLITLATVRGALPRLGGLPPEVMVRIAGDGDQLPELPPLDGFDAIVAGPGLNGGWPMAPELSAGLTDLWARDPRPLLFDADALASVGPPPPGAPRVLTPHPGEAGRILKSSTEEVQGYRVAAAHALANLGVAVLKGPHTLVAARDEVLSINPTGDPVLATGGSGDVLTGLIGGLLARGVPAFVAARLGVFVHGRAGEQLAARRADGWGARDIAAALPEAIQTLLAAP